MASGGHSDTLQDTEELLFISRQDGHVTRYGGWKIELLVEKIISVSEQKLLLCTLCKGMLRDACVITLEGKKQARCNVCVPPDTIIDAINTADLIRSAIDDRMINCPFLKEGCEWSGPTPEIHLYLKECLYLPVPCPLKCSQKFQRRFIQDHISQTCLMRLIPCEYCGSKVQASNINSHFAICLDFPTPCMNKCTFQSLEGKVFVASRRMIRKHLDSDCPLQKVICPYSKHGCKAQIVRTNIQAHKVEYMDHHFQLMETVLAQVTSDLTFYKQKDIDNANYINYLQKFDKPVAYSKAVGHNTTKKVTTIKVEFPYGKEVAHSYQRFHSTSACAGGYKFAFYVEFGDERNLGIYFYLLKGERDDKLEWPLKCKIYFILINQLRHSDLRKEMNSFDYPENKCFDKPTSDDFSENIGYSNFISHDDVMSLGYCTKGCIFLRLSLVCFVYMPL